MTTPSYHMRSQEDCRLQAMIALFRGEKASHVSATFGIGDTAADPPWGGMLSGAGRQFMERVPTLALFPGLAISIAVLAFNLFGDMLRTSWTLDCAVGQRRPHGMGFLP